MHELSIAQSVLDLARSHVPDGATLQSVRMVAGPMRCIDPECMQLAWQAISQDQVVMNLIVLPWKMQCADCGRQWEQAELAQTCACGSARIRPVGGDELQLLSIEVDDTEDDTEPERNPSCRCRLSKTS
jgi:Zn finger protein HypA/HybF involved in hydrogenase expression